MPVISPDQVRELRQRTAAGMMDCKRALESSDGDMEKAIEWLRQKGLATAAKKAGRATAEGIVDSYIHLGGRIGVMVEVNCETDFVARTDEFKSLVHDVAMHIAAASPRFVRRDEVPAGDIEKERAILRARTLEEGKPANIVDKIVEGRLEKQFYNQVCLEEQPFVKNPDITVSQLIKEAIGRLGENISVRRFVRFEMGEAMEAADRE